MHKQRPLLQIALDTLTIEEAIENVQKIREHIDVIEVGTILINSVGKEAVSILSRVFPEKIIIADVKTCDAGSIFGKMFYERGAKYVTATCAAEVETMIALQKEGKKISSENEVQIELTSNYTSDQVEKWHQAGIEQIIIHRARDAEKAGVKWTKENLDQVQMFADKGFKVSVTGGITKEDIQFFKGLPIYIFIAGRSIRDAADPKAEAKAFKDEIAKYW